MKLLEGKVALITGASRGIGKGIAELFVAQGATVIFTYASSEEKARAFEAELAAKGGKAKGYKSDAANYEAAHQLIDTIVAEFGTIDILVNNAGITRDTLLMRMSEEQWDEVMQVNLKSVFNLTKACIKPMLKAKSGSIINMSSVVGVKGNAGQANYAASKAGIIGFTGALDEKVVQEWRNTIPLKRGGSPEDVANATLFLASNMSSYITGQTLHVCGGMLM